MLEDLALGFRRGHQLDPGPQPRLEDLVLGPALGEPEDVGNICPRNPEVRARPLRLLREVLHRQISGDVLHEICPDRCRNRAPISASDCLVGPRPLVVDLEVHHFDLRICVTHPNRRRVLRDGTDEPHILEVLGGPRLPELGPPDIGATGGSTGARHLLQSPHYCGCKRLVKHPHRLRLVLIDEVAIGVLDALDQIAVDALSDIGQCRIGGRHLERCHRLRSQRNRQHRLQWRLDTHLVSGIDDVLGPDDVGDLRVDRVLRCIRCLL